MFTFEFELKEGPCEDMLLHITRVATMGGEVIERKEYTMTLEQAKGIQEFMNKLKGEE